MKRLLHTLLVALVACLGLAQPAVAATSSSVSVGTYTYDGHHTSAQFTATASERGPPRDGHNHAITYDLVDLWSHGTLPRPDGLTTLATAADAKTEESATDLRTTTTEQTQRSDGELSPLTARRVATNGGTDVVRHYTTREAAESIVKGGQINPGKSGKIWTTPDEYASGAQARAKLSLDKTPDGYFEIPTCRIQCPSAPSKVEPWAGQPGGGIEITTDFPIDIRGLIFRGFQ